MRFTTMTVAAVLIAPIAVQAEDKNGAAAYFTGVRLFESCKTDSVVCTTYVMAVTDAIAVLEFVNPSPSICIPPHVSVRQVILSFQSFVEKHPIMLNNPAADLIREGLHDMFPCKN